MYRTPQHIQRGGHPIRAVAPAVTVTGPQRRWSTGVAAVLSLVIPGARQKTPEVGRKYYWPFWPRSLTGAVFRAVTQVRVPGRGAKLHGFRRFLRFGFVPQFCG
jgi:hypothetical protein